MMGRSEVDEVDDWELAGPATGETTVVLVGRTGNGKSATGNSILGRKAFKSRSRSSAVTVSSELQQVQMNDGRILNVVDTPGLFDPAVHPDFVGKEIVKCIDLAKDGIHGVIFVLSVRNRFTAEEAAAVEGLQMLFGDKILNYMVVIFTGGDELEENQETLEDYLHDSPLELQELLRHCDNRKVLFNNKATSKTVLSKQVNELLKQTDIIIAQNGGHPYSNELFREAQERMSRQEDIDSGGYSKEEIQHLKIQMENAYAEQLKQLTEMIEITYFHLVIIAYVKDIKCVINYAFPGSMENYVDCIGRTGRGGAKGKAYTYFTAANARFSKDLIKFLQEARQSISPSLAEMGRSSTTSGGYGGFRDRGRGSGNLRWGR